MTVGTTGSATPVAVVTDGAEERPRDARRIPGEEGLWVFILGDMAIFALFFGAIMVLRGQQTAVFRASQHALHPGLGIVNTGLLLTGSLLVVLGTRAIRAASRRAALLFGAALVCGAGFAAVKAIEYTDLVSGGHTPQTNDFFMYYFVFTGIHLAHLVIGMVLLSVLAVQSRRPDRLTRGRLVFVDCGACYWHMVDLLWLLLFPLLYLVR